MSKTSVIQPWKKTCTLRQEIRDRKHTASDFAVDLQKVINGGAGVKPFYCDPEQFFATTYATQNLRQLCKVVLRRLAEAGGGEPIINVAQTFGGGKTHTLTAFYYLTTLGAKLPKMQTSVGMILNDAQLKESTSGPGGSRFFRQGGLEGGRRGEIAHRRNPSIPHAMEFDCLATPWTKRAGYPSAG